MGLVNPLYRPFRCVRWNSQTPRVKYASDKMSKANSYGKPYSIAAPHKPSSKHCMA